MTKDEFLRALKEDPEIRDAVREFIRAELILEDEEGARQFHEPYLGMVDSQIGNHGSVQYLLNRDVAVDERQDSLDARLGDVFVKAVGEHPQTPTQVALEAGTLSLPPSPGQLLNLVKVAAWRALEALRGNCECVRVADTTDLAVDLEALRACGFFKHHHPSAVVRDVLLQRRRYGNTRALRRAQSRALGWEVHPTYGIVLLNAAPKNEDHT